MCYCVFCMVINDWFDGIGNDRDINNVFYVFDGVFKYEVFRYVKGVVVIFLRLFYSLLLYIILGSIICL